MGPAATLAHLTGVVDLILTSYYVDFLTYDPPHMRGILDPYLVSCGIGDGTGTAAAALGSPPVSGVVLQGGQAIISGHGSLL